MEGKQVAYGLSEYMVIHIEPQSANICLDTMLTLKYHITPVIER